MAFGHEFDSRLLHSSCKIRTLRSSDFLCAARLLCLFSSPVQRAGSNERSDVCPALEIPKENLSAGSAVTVRLVMIKRNSIVVTQIVQLMADARKNASSHLDRADIAYIRLPLNFIRKQAFLQNTHIELSISDIYGSIFSQTSGKEGAFRTDSSLIPVSIVLKGSK